MAGMTRWAHRAWWRSPRWARKAAAPGIRAYATWARPVADFLTQKDIAHTLLTGPAKGSQSAVLSVSVLGDEADVVDAQEWFFKSTPAIERLLPTPVEEVVTRAVVEKERSDIVLLVLPKALSFLTPPSFVTVPRTLRLRVAAHPRGLAGAGLEKDERGDLEVVRHNARAVARRFSGPFDRLFGVQEGGIGGASGSVERLLARGDRREVWVIEQSGVWLGGVVAKRAEDTYELLARAFAPGVENSTQKVCRDLLWAAVVKRTSALGLRGLDLGPCGPVLKREYQLWLGEESGSVQRDPWQTRVASLSFLVDAPRVLHLFEEDPLVVMDANKRAFAITPEPARPERREEMRARLLRLGIERVGWLGQDHALLPWSS